MIYSPEDFDGATEWWWPSDIRYYLGKKMPWMGLFRRLDPVKCHRLCIFAIKIVATVVDSTMRWLGAQRAKKKINGGLSSALAMVEWQIYFLHSFYLSRTYIACNNVPFSFHSHKCWIAKRNWHRICKWLAPHNMDYVPNCTTARCTIVYKTITGNTSICLDSIEPKTASWVNELKHCDSMQLSTHTQRQSVHTTDSPKSTTTNCIKCDWVAYTGVHRKPIKNIATFARFVE